MREVSLLVSAEIQYERDQNSALRRDSIPLVIA